MAQRLFYPVLQMKVFVYILRLIGCYFITYLDITPW